MSWVGVGVAAVGAIKGTMDANHNRKQARAHDAYRKQAIMYSPWTGMGDPGAANVGNTDTFSGMLGGAAQGYAVGSGIGKGFSKLSSDKFTTSTSSPLGGDDMSAQLGKEFSGDGSGLQAANQALNPGIYKSMAATNPASAGALGANTLSADKLQMPQVGGLYASMQKPRYGLGM